MSTPSTLPVWLELLFLLCVTVMTPLVIGYYRTFRLTIRNDLNKQSVLGGRFIRRNATSGSLLWASPGGIVIAALIFLTWFTPPNPTRFEIASGAWEVAQPWPGIGFSGFAVGYVLMPIGAIIVDRRPPMAWWSGWRVVVALSWTLLALGTAALVVPVAVGAP